MLYVKHGKLAHDSNGVIRAQTFRTEVAGRGDLRMKSSNADATWKKRKKKKSFVTVSSFIVPCRARTTLGMEEW